MKGRLFSLALLPVAGFSMFNLLILVLSSCGRRQCNLATQLILGQILHRFQGDHTMPISSCWGGEVTMAGVG